MDERRKSVRYKIGLVTTCARNRKRIEKARTADISTPGMMINRLFKIGLILDTSFSLPNLRDSLHMKGKVVRNDSKGSGIKFLQEGLTNRSIKVIGDYIKQKISPSVEARDHDFIRLLRNHKQEDERTIREVFYLASLMLLYKTEETKKILKRKEICWAVDVVRMHLDKGFVFDVTGNLAENFGDFPYEQAVEYYDKKVQSTVKDMHNREVLIDEEGLEFLFKDPITGKHDRDMKPQNYHEPRGKRLPWIRYIIQNSNEIYESYELHRQENIYYYIGKALVKTSNGLVVPNYFMIVTYKKKGQKIIFKTAYHMDDKMELLKKICQARVYVLPSTWTPTEGKA